MERKLVSSKCEISVHDSLFSHYSQLTLSETKKKSRFIVAPSKTTIFRCHIARILQRIGCTWSRRKINGNTMFSTLETVAFFFIIIWTVNENTLYFCNHDFYRLRSFYMTYTLYNHECEHLVFIILNNNKNLNKQNSGINVLCLLPSTENDGFHQPTV